MYNKVETITIDRIVRTSVSYYVKGRIITAISIVLHVMKRIRASLHTYITKKLELT